MSEEALADLTPRGFANKLKGFFELEEQKQRREWERTRWMTWLLIDIQLEEKYKLNDPKQLVKFDWEQDSEKTESKVLSKEEVDAIFSKWEKPQ